MRSDAGRRGGGGGRLWMFSSYWFNFLGEMGSKPQAKREGRGQVLEA